MLLHDVGGLRLLGRPCAEPPGQSAAARLLREDPPPGRTSTSRAAASDGPDLLSLASKTVAGVSSDAEAGAGPATGILQLTWCSWVVCDSVQGWMTPINADFRRKLMLTVVGFTCESKMASEERAGSACQAGAVGRQEGQVVGGRGGKCAQHIYRIRRTFKNYAINQVERMLAAAESLMTHESVNLCESCHLIRSLQWQSAYQTSCSVQCA